VHRKNENNTFSQETKDTMCLTSDGNENSVEQEVEVDEEEEEEEDVDEDEDTR